MKENKTKLYDSELYYWIENDGDSQVLHIDGKGDMPNFGTWIDDFCPWWGSHFDKAIVHEGVTSLGEYAFYDIPDLKSVSLPLGLKYISSHCFEGCSGIKSISIPYGVREINDYTFRDCTSLEEIIIPSSVFLINRFVFFGCMNLKNVKIPDSVKRIHPSAFSTAELSVFDLSETRYELYDDCIYSDNHFIAASYKKDVVKIRPGTSDIASYAFCCCDNLIEVHLPQSVRYIYRKAFHNCINLKTVFIDSDVYFEENAFFGCNADISRSCKSTSLTAETGKLATTRRGYAVLKNGCITFSRNAVDADISAFLNYNDFVDVAGGFDFIIGLRKDGEVIVTVKKDREKTIPFPSFIESQTIRIPAFPQYSHFSVKLKQVSASESRVAGVDTDGELFHICENNMEQLKISVPHTKAKCAAAGFDTVAYIDKNDVFCYIPYEKTASEINRMIRSNGDKPIECKIYNPYYSMPTVAVLTSGHRLLWSYDVDDSKIKRTEGYYKRFAVGSYKVAAINESGEVFLFYGDKAEKIDTDGVIVDIGLIHNEKLIMLRDDGSIKEMELD